MPFGRSRGGGRRSAARTPGPMLAVVTTLSNRRSAMVLDISSAGVRLSGEELPLEGELIEIRIGHVTSFGRVVWRNEGQCGIAFDPRLRAADVEELRASAGKTSLSSLSLEEQVALEEWLLGISR